MSDDGATALAPKAGGAKKKKKSTPIDSDTVLRVRWDLHDLPSSQHRAGLAGLALSVAFLKRKSDRKGVCDVEGLDEFGLTLAVDRAGMQSLFDDLYDAYIDTTRPSAQGKEQDQLPTVPSVETADKEQRVNLARENIGRLVPRGEFIADLDQGAEGAKPWLTLWRDMVWTTTRDRARGPYRNRAAGIQLDDGGETWDELQKRSARGEKLSGTFQLGTEEATADGIEMHDAVGARFLLRFWRLVAFTYVISVATRDSPEGNISKPQYYAIAVPDVANLESFVHSWPMLLRRRGTTLFRHRPHESVVYVPGEAGLDLLRLSQVTLQMSQSSIARGALCGVDVFHIKRGQQGYSMRSVVRVDAVRRTIDEYSRVRDANYVSPLFRRERVSNVLDSQAWWNGFGRLSATTPIDLTFQNASFRHDCKAALTEVEMKEDVPEAERTLEHLIFKRVQAYVLGRTEQKYELSWSTARGNLTREKDYSEKREKVAREAFLAVRSRTGADFIAYFTGTICSVRHPATEARFLELARALLDPKETEKVRSLTLLALSAVA